VVVAQDQFEVERGGHVLAVNLTTFCFRGMPVFQSDVARALSIVRPVVIALRLILQAVVRDATRSSSHSRDVRQLARLLLIELQMLVRKDAEG
jgi:hypothetical protein